VRTALVVAGDRSQTAARLERSPHLLPGRLSQNYAFLIFAQLKLLNLGPKKDDFACSETASRGEGGPRRALSPAVAGRMRGHFRRSRFATRRRDLHEVTKNRR
jgi:hypothetical protein